MKFEGFYRHSEDRRHAGEIVLFRFCSRRLASVLREGRGGAGGPPAGGSLSLQQPALAGLHGDGGRRPGAHLPVARLQGAGAHQGGGADRRRQHPGAVSHKALSTRLVLTVTQNFIYTARPHSDTELYLQGSSSQ